MERSEYERRKEEVADEIVQRLEAIFPGLKQGTLFRCSVSPLPTCFLTLHENCMHCRAREQQHGSQVYVPLSGVLVHV